MNMAKERNEAKANMVKLLRESRAWSQAQLAEVAGVTERTVQRLEKDGIASNETWMGIAQAFDKNVSDFNIPSSEEVKQEKLLKKLRILIQLNTGKSVLDLTAGADGYLPNSPQPANEEEAELFGGFLDHASECGEMWEDMNQTQRMEAYLETEHMLKNLESKGYFVFGERKATLYKTNNNSVTLNIAVIAITSAKNPAIVDDGKGNRMWPVVYEK